MLRSACITVANRIQLRKQIPELDQAPPRRVSLAAQRINGDQPRASIPEISADRDRALEPIDRPSVITLDERRRPAVQQNTPIAGEPGGVIAIAFATNSPARSG